VYYHPQTIKYVYGVVGNQMAKRRSKIYSRCSCDDTNIVAPKDVETSNRSIGFNNAMIMIMLCIEMCQRVCRKKKIGWALSSTPECSPSQRARMRCSVRKYK